MTSKRCSHGASWDKPCLYCDEFWARARLKEANSHVVYWTEELASLKRAITEKEKADGC